MELVISRQESECGVEIVKLRRDELKIVADWQRENVNWQEVEKLREQFNPEIGNVLLVWLDPSDGLYHIIDGQRRYYTSGSDVFLAVVTTADPGPSFITCNNGRKVSGRDKFWVLYSRNGRVERDVIDQCHANGIDLARGDRFQSQPQVLMLIHEALAPKQFSKFVEALAKRWHRPYRRGIDKRAVQSTFLRGVLEYFRTNGTPTGFDKASKILATTYTCDQLVQEAKERKGSGSGAAYKELAAMLHDPSTAFDD